MVVLAGTYSKFHHRLTTTECSVPFTIKKHAWDIGMDVSCKHAVPADRSLLILPSDKSTLELLYLSQQ